MTTELTRRGLFKRAGAMALLAPAVLTATVAPAIASDEEIDAFFNAGFNDCEADKLRQYWQVGYREAKEMAGAKILRGDKKFLRQAIRKASRQFSCESTGFNYKDSDAVAEFWKHS